MPEYAVHSSTEWFNVQRTLDKLNIHICGIHRATAASSKTKVMMITGMVFRLNTTHTYTFKRIRCLLFCLYFIFFLGFSMQMVNRMLLDTSTICAKQRVNVWLT